MSVVRRLVALLLAVLAGLAWPQAMLAAKTHALLIGAGEYRAGGIERLAGPANDLRAMQALMQDIGAERQIVLRDERATRSDVERALYELGSTAAPGDWIVIYYTGHGAQAVVAGGDRGGRLVQFVPLSGFDPDQQDPEHFIVDKDFYAWMKLYIAPEVNILMMVDSCHSGSMQRSIKPQLYSYVARAAFTRRGQPLELVARPGPRFGTLLATGSAAAAEIDTLEPEDLPNLVYFGASQDGQLALEMQLPVAGGESRGLLTFAFEQGMRRSGTREDRPAADLDGDGVVLIEEMAAYLGGQVHLMSAFRQDSTATFSGERGGTALLSAARPTLGWSSEPPPSLQIVPPMSPEAVGETRSFRVAATDAAADFRWQRITGNLYRRSGDIVAEALPSIAEVDDTITKWQTIAALAPLAAERSVRLTLAPFGFDWLYEPGSRIALSLRRLPGWQARPLYATIFNLASDGTVQLIYPLAGEDGRLPTGKAETDLLEVEVTAPLGTDHLIVVTTSAPADYLRAVLRTADGKRAGPRVIRPLQHELKQAGAAGSLAIFELYTGR